MRSSSLALRAAAARAAARAAPSHRSLHLLARATAVHVPSTLSSSSSLPSSSTPSRPFAAKASMSSIKSLRERTGAPMMECKEALQAVLDAGTTDGSEEAVMAAAIEQLRKKGIATAAKKSGRVASEGLVALEVREGAASLVEVNSETDFAAKNDLFRTMCAYISKAAIHMAQHTEKAGEMELSQLQAASCVDPTARDATVPVATAITNVVTSLRENLQVRRVAGLRVQDGVVGSYMHNAVKAEDIDREAASPQLKMGRQGAIIGIEVEGEMKAEDKAELQQIANKLAMQVVASQPRYVSREEVPAEVMAKERQVLTEQANTPPKPVPGQPIKPFKPKDAKQVEKMVEGRINKWLSEISLVDQQYLIGGEDGKPPMVSKVLAEQAEKIGSPVRVSAFVRFLVGEGVQNNKDADAFAKEVAEKLAKAQ